VNVASVEIAPSSVNAPVLAGGPLAIPTSLAGESQLGAFRALFSGFVAKNESGPLLGSAEQQPLKKTDVALSHFGKDREKDNKSEEKAPAALAAAAAPSVLDLPPLLAKPLVALNLLTRNPTEQQAGTPAADNTNSLPIGASSPRDQQSSLQPQLVFALRLTPDTTQTAPLGPALAQDASATAASKSRSEVGAEPPQNSSFQSEPAPQVQPGGERQTSNHQPEPVQTTADPQDNRMDSPVSADRLASTGTQPEQTTAGSLHNPGSERVVLPRVQQQSTQQEAGSGQPGPRDSKAQTTDRQDQAPERNQSRTEKNPIAFEPQAQTTAETKTTAIESGRPESNSREATILPAEIETKATVQPQPRQISLKLEGPDSQKVDILLTDRAGRVDVAVRTADRQLAKSLQGDLGDLVGRLENKGFKTEAWVPAASHAVAAPVASGKPASGQGQPGQSGSGAGQQQRQGQNGSNQRQQPRWAAQLDETLSADEMRKENE
jgi:hypothetical protein